MELWSEIGLQCGWWCEGQCLWGYEVRAPLVMIESDARRVGGGVSVGLSLLLHSPLRFCMVDSSYLPRLYLVFLIR